MAKYNIPHYCKIIVEGRINKDVPWSLRNAFKDENAAVFGGELPRGKLLAKANNIAEEWRRNYPNSGETRVVVNE